MTEVAPAPRAVLTKRRAPSLSLSLAALTPKRPAPALAPPSAPPGPRPRRITRRPLAALGRRTAGSPPPPCTPVSVSDDDDEDDDDTLVSGDADEPPYALPKAGALALVAEETAPSLGTPIVGAVEGPTAATQVPNAPPPVSRKIIARIADVPPLSPASPSRFAPVRTPDAEDDDAYGARTWRAEFPFVIEVEPRAIAYHTALEPPPWYARRRAGLGGGAASAA
ncbi:hypothetical protein HYPSUDRAFT_53825 [Hypholoma sublateritium FD-334 SS-4]|uniref:Uncharacterized protein n=1 Tax=Hypholoma sublateritium (strain FD-334 SS-4) TaxID=945553 RepID=A0A0D2PXS8_HYPSF|nr:hypothetical protein HYPSUDRAFT_53825 [Hypholoma sublateritium FD-334 SS-4]